MEEVQLNSLGHIIEITVQNTAADGTRSARDISGQTALKIFGKAPVSRTVQTWTAALTTDGTDGKMRYTTTATSDLNESGVWKIQGNITEGATPIYDTEIGDLRVIDNLA